MDEFDRDSNASSENEAEDETMADIDDNNEANDDNADDDDDNDNEGENENEDDDDDNEQNDEEDDTQQDQPTNTSDPTATRTSATPGASSGLGWQPTIRPEYLNAKTYDIVPTMAAPMSTSVNCMASTPDLRYILTGGNDGYVRKFHGPDTINGKQMLTVAQRHPFVESVVKAGVLMGYWENAEPQPTSSRADDIVLSPVYSLAVHSSALWSFAGLESGGINLHSVRHDEGKRITCLQQHTNAVSVLTLGADEKSMLSGSWDKHIFDWDLNTGFVKRSFYGSGGQVSAIETRPVGGMPIPPEASEEPVQSDTFFSNNDQPPAKGAFTNGINGGATVKQEVNGVNGVTHAETTGNDGNEDAQGSPANDSLFGSPTNGDDLFGDNDDGMGGFGGDEDNEFSRAMAQETAKDGIRPQGDNEVPMGDFDMPAPTFDTTAAPAEQSATEFDASTAPQTEPSQQQQQSSVDADAEADESHQESTLPALPDFSLDNTEHDPTQTFESETSQPQAEVSHDPEASGSHGDADAGSPAQSPSAMLADDPPSAHDAAATSDSTFLSATIDGQLKIWDKRMPNPIARIGNRPGVPPWCMGACWSPDGNYIYAGRRNGTVEEFSIAKATSGWQPERVFRFPAGSGPVSCVRPMANGRHLICASNDILRLYDLRSSEARAGADIKGRHAPPPFLVVPGPPRAGVISSLSLDPSGRFMFSTSGTRGWEGTSTEVLIGYEINAVV